MWADTLAWGKYIISQWKMIYKEMERYSGIGRNNTGKMSLLLKVIYRFNVITSKIPMAIFQK